MRTHRCARPGRSGTVPGRRDTGAVALIVVLFTIAMFAFAGLVIDGGAALAARGRAADLAEQASRAGVDAIDPASLRGRRPADLRVDPADANRAAQDVLAAGDAGGDVTVAATSVTVTARVTRRSVVLAAFGVNQLSGSATSTATLLHGTTTGEAP